MSLARRVINSKQHTHHGREFKLLEWPYDTDVSTQRINLIGYLEFLRTQTEQ